MSLLCRKRAFDWIIILVIGLFPDFLIAQEALKHPVSVVKSFSIESMSLDDKVGLLLMVGFPQNSLDSKLEEHLAKIHASSFIFFKRNITSLYQAAQLTHDLNLFSSKRFSVPALLAIDQEGGAVARITTIPSTPNAFSVGLTKNPAIAYELGQETGRILKQYGFNMNLAPVLDITSANKNNFIGLRSFSSFYDVVGQLGLKYSQGLISAGVLPTAKHFPGMSSVEKDPHLELVESSRTLDQIQKEDLFPYKKYIQLGSNTAIMMSHLVYPSIDETRTPALFSAKISKDLLRTKLGYRGLVITDDIQMKSSQSVSNTWTNAIRSLKAGADMIILSWSFRDQEKTFYEIRRAVKTGQLSILDINEKVRRILKVKHAFANKEAEPPIAPLAVHSSGRLAEISQKVLSYGVEGLLSELPVLSDKKSICIYSSNKNFISSFQKIKSANLRLFQIGESLRSEDVLTHLEKNICDLNLISIYGKMSSFLVTQIKNPKLVEKTWAINFSHPATLAYSWPEKQTLQVGFPYANSGQSFGQALSRVLGKNLTKKYVSELQAQGQHELGRLPAEQTPSVHHPKTQ